MTHDRAVAVERTILSCQLCGAEVDICYGCGEYFTPGDTMICTNDATHYHESCWTEKKGADVIKWNDERRWGK